MGGEGVCIVGCVFTLLKRTARWRWTCFRIPPNKIKSVLPIHCITVELKLKGFSSFLFLLILVSCNQLAICLAWFLPAALGPPKVVNDELVPLLANQAARLQRKTSQFIYSGKSRAVWYSLDLTKAVIHPLSPKSVVWFSLCKAYNSALEIEAHLPPQLILYQLYSLSSILYDQLEQLENPIWCWCCRCHWLSSLWSLTVVCKNCKIKKTGQKLSLVNLDKSGVGAKIWITNLEINPRINDFLRKSVKSLKS